jgi:hypothetical protein
VRDMLIDDGNAIRIDRDDKRVAELAKRHQRFDQIRRVRLIGRPEGRHYACGGQNIRRSAGLQASRIRPAARINSSAQYIRDRLGHRLGISIGVREQLQFWNCAFAYRIGHSVLYGFMNERLVAKSHFSFRRMHVHVDAIGGDFEKEVDLRAAFLYRRVAVGIDNRVRNRLVLDDTAIDEHVLRATRRSLVGQRGDNAPDAEAGQHLSDWDEIGSIAKNLIQPVFEFPDCRPVEDSPRPVRQGKADFRIPEGKLRDDARDLCGFAGIGLEKFPPRRQVVKQITNLDRRAFGSSDFLNRRDGAAVDANLRSRDVTSEPRFHDEMRDRRNARQRFAAKPKSVNRGEIVGAVNLARRVPIEREARVVRAHAVAVILDAHEPLSPHLDVDLNAPRARVDGVFDQFFDDRCRALDDLTCGDLIG